MSSDTGSFVVEPADPRTLTPVTISLADLKPHPRNYQTHPDDQLDHLVESITEHGIYRNVVVARDFTILAGHGVTEAAKRVGLTTIPVIRLDIDPESPRALKVLAGDNEIGHLREPDDRALSELLREIAQADPVGLLGTGYDEAMLANLVFVTRPASEIADFNQATHWAGMPEYEPADPSLQLIVNFLTETDRERFAATFGLTITGKTKSVWWPPKSHDDLASLRVEG